MRIFNSFLEGIVLGTLISIPLLLLVVFIYGLISLVFPNKSCAGERLATMSANRFLGDGTSNPYSLYNNPYNAESPNNRFGPYGNPYSPYSVNNPYAVDGPGIYGSDE